MWAFLVKTKGVRRGECDGREMEIGDTSRLSRRNGQAKFDLKGKRMEHKLCI